MSEIVYYSEIIKEKYKIKKLPDGNRIVFESGVNYREKEVRHIHNVSDDMKVFVHKIKGLFGGTIERTINKEE